MKKLAPREFVSEFYYYAEESEKKYKVPALLTLAQAALETGWGEHAPGNNAFGIKCAKNYTGPSQLLPTMEYEHGKWVKKLAKFMVYDNIGQSFNDHGAFLVRQFPWATGNADPIQYAEAIQSRPKFKYATDKDYLKKIISLVNTFRHLLTERKLNGEDQV